jgi:hypothetical protein
MRAWIAGIPLVLTNVVFFGVLLVGGMRHYPDLFLTRDEAAAVDWLAAGARGSVVLASPELSLWLPGMADVRVVYGHPMETPFAVKARQDVETFFQPAPADAQIKILLDRQVNWIVCSDVLPGCVPPGNKGFVEVFASGDVRVFAVRTP